MNDWMFATIFVSRVFSIFMGVFIVVQILRGKNPYEPLLRKKNSSK